MWDRREARAWVKREIGMVWRRTSFAYFSASAVISVCSKGEAGARVSVRAQARFGVDGAWRERARGQCALSTSSLLRRLLSLVMVISAKGRGAGGGHGKRWAAFAVRMAQKGV